MNSLKITEELLILNPEFNAIWNFRRDIISALKDTLTPEFWEKELQFIMVQLKRYPKVYWIWSYRVWIIKNYPYSPLKIWKSELEIVNRLLDLDARNYHGWHYRRIVVSAIEEIEKSSQDAPELFYATEIINKNISNYSAWHQRVQLITRMFQSNEIIKKKEFLLKEVDYFTNAMFTDAEDQSIWFYINWFIKYSFVLNTLGKDDYLKMLSTLQSNINTINDDDLDFSGKENNWCLKLLIVIHKIRVELGEPVEEPLDEYLHKLIEADPLRKNRYLYLLSTV